VVAALMLSAPFEKLAVPVPPSAVFNELRKVEGVNDVDAPPFTLMVSLVKSTATLCCRSPLEPTMAMLVVPVKSPTIVGRSRPVLRPVSVCGGGTAVLALLTALSAFTAPLT
jgi:hypothetical protein